MLGVAVLVQMINQPSEFVIELHALVAAEPQVFLEAHAAAVIRDPNPLAMKLSSYSSIVGVLFLSRGIALVTSSATSLLAAWKTAFSAGLLSLREA